MRRKVSIIALTVALLSGVATAASGQENKAAGSQEKTAAGSQSSAASEHAVRYLTTAQFKDLVVDYTTAQTWDYKGEVPCVIDFYATWCGPCKRIAPVMEELAKEYGGRVIFYKVDTDKERELAQVFGISSIPTLLFIPAKGQPFVAKGALPKETLKAYVDKLFKEEK